MEKFLDKKKSLFTLIELMVVVAIIAILASMLLPALNKARNVARKIRCTSNVKQLGIGMACYTFDNNGFMPPVGWQNSGSYLLWNSMIGQYVGIPQINTWGSLYNTIPLKSVFWCDSMIKNDNGARYYTSYGYNAATFGGWNYGSTPRPIKNTQIKQPSMQMTVVETWYGYDNLNNRSRGRAYMDNQNYLCFRHNKTANTLYLDGHAKAEEQRQLWMGHPYSYPWNTNLSNRSWFVYSSSRANWGTTYGYSPYQ